MKKGSIGYAGQFRLRAIPLFSRTKTERAGKWQKGAETRGKIEGLPL